MLIFEEIGPIKEYLNRSRKEGKSIGLVPTMGALHAGHISLIEASAQENDLTVCSIFVNPAQFNEASDLKNYPRTPEKDIAMLENTHCSVLFMPKVEEMYPGHAATTLHFGALETIMEGAFRNGHFKGVGLIVSKLFHIISPHTAYFGQKDLQQFAIIRQMVQDLDFDVNLICAPIVRESDGLAMSSRNLRLSAEERKQASTYYQALAQAAQRLQNGEEYSLVKEFVHNFVAQKPLLRLEYFEMVNKNTLQALSTFEKGNTALCIAGFAGPIRLIDNIIV